MDADKKTEDGLLELRNINEGEERLIVAYNSVVSQTDHFPCSAASGGDICELYENGLSICAANDLPFGTTIYIEDYGECVIMDRLNSKYTDNRIDIFMGDDVEGALGWGAENKNVLYE